MFCGWKPYPEAYRERIEALEASGRFGPESAKVKVTEEGGLPLILVGRPEEDSPRQLKQLLGKAVRAAREEKAKALAIDLSSYHGPMETSAVIRCAARAAWEASYRFTAYLSDRGEQSDLEEVVFTGCDLGEPEQKALAEGDLLGQTVFAVRDAVNRTSRDLTPEALAHWVCERAKGAPYEVEVLGEPELERLGAKALLSVSAGSHYPPRMIVMRYQGDPSHPERRYALLGKGVTFDSGGLSLKSKSGMITMHHDMGGAAAAAGAFDLLARMGTKLNLTAVLPACENMLAAKSYRPGDVIETMNGKTVLIKSTDAEGRLILADAMTYAVRREKATALIDIATLTGGAASAFGPLINAVAVNDGALREAVGSASVKSGELTWEMPLLADYKSFLKAEHADLANSSAGAGSSMINAAIFLQEFTEGIPWLHIDSAGTSWAAKVEGCFSYGATGAGTVLLYDLFRELAE